MQPDILGPFGRKKLREWAAVADGLAQQLDQARATEQRYQDLLPHLEEQQRRLPLQLQALSRQPVKSDAERSALQEQQDRIEAEIVRNETELAEVRAEIAQTQARSSLPRSDRRAVLAAIDRVTRHAGDEGARMRAQLGGRAA